MTDGFFEWTNPSGEQFGIDRMIETVRRSKEKAAKEIIEALYNAVRSSFGATPRSDDLTAVVIKRIANWSRRTASAK